MVLGVANNVFYLNLIPSLIVFLVGVPGNCLIIYFFLIHQRRLRKSINVYNLLILQIAFTDLLTCLARATSIVVISVTSGSDSSFSSSVSDVFCRYVWSVPFAASEVSVCILFFLSLDRYVRIAHPFRRRSPKVIFHVAFTFSWLLSGVLCVYYYYWRTIDRQDTGLCLGLREPPTVLLVSTIVINLFGMFLVPVIAIIYLFKKSSDILKKQSRFIHETVGSSRQQQQQQQQQQQHHQQQQQQQHQQQTVTPQIRNHNTVAMNTLKCLTIVMLVTVALPKISLTLLHLSFTFGLDNKTFAIFEACVTSVVFINSAVNIFPYLYYIKDFRMFVMELLKPLR